MTKTKPIDVATAVEWLRYDPETGILTWVKRPGGQRKAGEEAGCVHRKGYIRVRVKGHGLVGSHRLAWVLYYGVDIPAGKQIDHINGVRSDNRIENLRLASVSENHHNSKIKAAHKIGLKGVYRSRGKFAAKIKPAGVRRVYLGCFDTAEEAHAAYSRAAAALCGEFASDGIR